MSDYPILSNAPIVESLVDVKIAPSRQLELAEVESIHSSIQAEYPSINTRSQFEVKLEAGSSEPAVEQSGGPVGFIFRSADNLSAVQSRLDGFTYSRFKPYSHWQDFISNAQRLWQIYASIVAPAGISRVGLRTINRLDFPMPVRELNEYILTYPELPRGNTARGINQYLMRLVVPQPDSSSTAIITQAMTPVAIDATTITIIFDIDVFQEFLPPVAAETAWRTFDTFRSIRNELFFDSLTDKAKELYR